MTKEKLSLIEKIEKNKELLSNLQRKEKNLSIQISNLEHRIENQERARQGILQKEKEKQEKQVEKPQGN